MIKQKLKVEKKRKDWTSILIKKRLLFYLFPVAVIILAFILLHQNTIVVFTIDRAILNHDDAFAINSKLDEIQRNFFVKGVVLDIDSPGGTSEAIEEIYYRIINLRENKPVVVSINSIGASGAYYIASPSNYIFSKPSSVVGGIGIIAEVPEEIEREDVITSGPFKGKRTREQVLEIIDLLKQDFINVIAINRGEKLRIDPIELTDAKLYIGIKAKEIGLVDELGSLQDAISKTANLAGLKFYKTVYVNPLKSKFDISLFIEESQIKTNTTTAPKFYHLYVNLGEGT